MAIYAQGAQAPSPDSNSRICSGGSSQYSAADASSTKAAMIHFFVQTASFLIFPFDIVPV